MLGFSHVFFCFLQIRGDLATKITAQHNSEEHVQQEDVRRVELLTGLTRWAFFENLRYLGCVGDR